MTEPVPAEPGQPRVVRVGLVQSSCSDDPAENLAQALRGIGEAAARGADVVCLQELFQSTYPCQNEDVARFDLAESVPGPGTEALGKAAAEHCVVVLGSHFERRAAGVYHNTASVIDADGALVGRYRKMHIPDDPLYQEKFYFAPGDLGFLAHDTRVGRLGALLCWDQWFPEAARLTALAGAEILFYPTAIGWQFDESPDEDATQHESWETMQRAHAIANGVFVVAVNRVGHERLPGAAADDGIRFWGQSFVVDPRGRVIARASANSEEVLVVDCDLSTVERARREWPFLRDRRIDAYGDLERRLRDES